MFHPQVYYLVPAGCLTADLSDWIEAHQKFFLPVRALSKLFRAMLRDALQAFDPELFQQVPKEVWRKDWVVHSKPAGNGNAVLKYFAPYVFRVAISNKRLIKLEACPERSRRNDQVTFVYKHPRTKRWTPMTLPVFEFLRRFLQHVLPRGFKKVRHFGFLASRNKQLMALLNYPPVVGHSVLGTVELEPEDEPEAQSKIPCCPVCGKPRRVK
ncbi:MAG: transposase [candidate division KSB1 bacterium]|nr:transposase [candidate division KSB1 bacterium]